MAEGKNSFVLYNDIIHTVRKLPKEKIADLFVTILEYVNDLDPEVNDPIVDLVFEPIKQGLKRDLKKWNHKILTRAEAGRIGGLKSGESRQSKQTKQMLQREANEAVSVSVSDSVIVSGIVRENRRFTPPTQNEVCNEMMKSLDDFTAQAEAEKFFDYYESNGWMVGKVKMKKWKNTVRNWIRNSSKFKKTSNGENKLGTSEARGNALKNW